jgi:hypothetical protein
MRAATFVWCDMRGQETQDMQKTAAIAFTVVLGLFMAVDAWAQPWVARHGMTSAQYQSEFNAWTAQGFRLTHVSGYTVGGQARFAAIWEQKPGPAWVARHGLTSAQYQAEFDAWVRQGYRLVVVDGYESGGEARYAAIWEQKTGPAWIARHGMTSSEYQNEFNTRVGQGYRLTWVQGYGVGGFDYYAAIWEKSTGPAWVARHGMTSAEYQSEFDAFVARGYRLTHVSGYNAGGTDHYAAIWQASGGPAWVARHRLTSGGYQHEFTDRYLQGYRLKQVDGYPLSTADRYGAIWEAEPNAQTGRYCANGQCFDLGRFGDLLTDSLQGTVMKFGFEIRRGLSVIQHAEGLKRTAADPPASAFTVADRFNPASVSKTVTAVAVLQLLAKNRISINTPIYHYLPTNWTIPQNNKTITFKEVLTHTSGLRNGSTYEYSGVKTVLEDEINLGDKFQEYANVNYAVLRILVASLDGYSDWVNSPGPNTAARFIKYVNTSVLNPLGVYNVQYKPASTAPTLFYPNPAGNSHGTTYGDWSLRPGSAGVQVSVHELALFGDALFKGSLLPTATLTSMKQNLLGIWDYGTLPDGSQCWGHNGYFPASWNNGAELSSFLVHCSNGLTGTLVLNGEISSTSKFMDALKAAFSPQ